MYGNLGLIGNFSKGGEARTAWRIGKVLEDLGRSSDAEKYYEEARQGLETLVRPAQTELCEKDFEGLLNYCDS